MTAPEIHHGGTENSEKALPHRDLTDSIIGAAIEVHRALGPGLLESVYEECFCRELAVRGLEFRRQLPVPISHKGVFLDASLRLDLMVESKVVVELKSVEEILPVYEAQLLTFLRLTGCRVGLLLNFNVRTLREGIVRRVL